MSDFLAEHRLYLFLTCRRYLVILIVSACQKKENGGSAGILAFLTAFFVFVELICFCQVQNVRLHDRAHLMRSKREVCLCLFSGQHPSTARLEVFFLVLNTSSGVFRAVARFSSRKAKVPGSILGNTEGKTRFSRLFLKEKAIFTQKSTDPIF